MSWAPTQLTVVSGLQSQVTAPTSQVLLVGNLGSLSYAQLKEKLGDVTAEQFARTVGAAGKETCVKEGIVNDAVQYLHVPDKPCQGRNECDARPHEITKFIKKVASKFAQVAVVLAVDKKHVFATVAAITRPFHLFNMKTTVNNKVTSLVIEVLAPIDNGDVACLNALVDGIRDAARLIDMPANILHVDAFVDHAKQVAAKLGQAVSINVIQGEDLLAKGFGGIYHVGKQSLHPPAFVCLSYKPSKEPENPENIVIVGKGIIFDTGGMQIKGKTTMPTMKHDMGGAAAMLGAFQVLVSSGFKHQLHCILCLAENMIGPKANRPDDIITFLSGKTAEITNTDAEGRLVLSDGVFYAKTVLNATTIVDMATLTGAQKQATGTYHCALLCNDEGFEQQTIVAGRRAGELCHPLPFCPSLHMPDLKSPFADMKNSNLGSMTGPPSALAGLFIGSHIGFYSPQWLHIDMATLVHDSEKATGYGVSLITSLFGKHTSVELLQ